MSVPATICQSSVFDGTNAATIVFVRLLGGSLDLSADGTAVRRLKTQVAGPVPSPPEQETLSYSYPSGSQELVFTGSSENFRNARLADGTLALQADFSCNGRETLTLVFSRRAF
jgi:hypothetical protein